MTEVIDQEALASTVRGPVLAPGDSGYDDVRQVWNGMFDRRPGLIARCTGAADVIAAVNYARDRGLLVAVRGGGHSFPGHSVCDGGLMIDLSLMKSIRVDPAARRVRAEPGVLWGEFDRETQTFGLATTGGMISHTGIAGLTLGGGFGWLCRTHGLSIDNLLSCDVVTAVGDLLHAGAEENPDLFWALRGGGGNFGVVTSYEYRLHPLGPVLGGLIVYPLDEARQVMHAYDQVVRDAPDDLMVGCFLLTTPEGQKAAGIAPAYLGGDHARGEKLLEPFRRLGKPLMEQVGPMPYTALQCMIDGAAEPGRRYYMRSNLLAGLAPGAIEAMVDGYAASPSPFNAAVIVPFGGAVNRVAPDATAFAHRSARYSMTLLGGWTSPGDDEANTNWLRGVWDRLQPHLGEGVYVNELVDEGAARVQQAYGAQTYARLQALKRRYDPGNLFRLNQNIPPGP